MFAISFLGGCDPLLLFQIVCKLKLTKMVLLLPQLDSNLDRLLLDTRPLTYLFLEVLPRKTCTCNLFLYPFEK